MARLKKIEGPLPVVGTVAPEVEAAGLWRLVRRNLISAGDARRLVSITTGEARILRKHLWRFAALKTIIFRQTVLRHLDWLAVRGK